jgi:GntR family transcriptional regulator
VDLQVSVITVKRAYLELEREGVIVTQQGKGSQVAPNPGLGTKLQEEELKKHLEQAIRLADLLGLRPRELEGRLRETGDRLMETDAEKENA